MGFDSACGIPGQGIHPQQRRENGTTTVAAGNDLVDSTSPRGSGLWLRLERVGAVVGAAPVPFDVPHGSRETVSDTRFVFAHT